jgi:hypothetical protein
MTMQLFQIYESDLQRAEYAFKRLNAKLDGGKGDAETQVLLEELSEILSGVRTNYGAPAVPVPPQE